jgi:hypothetical protein
LVDDPGVHLRPLGIGELLDAATKVCVAHWRTLLKIVLFVVVPVQVLSTVVTASTAPEDAAVTFLDFGAGTATPDDETAEDLGTFFAGQVVVLVLQVVMFVLGTGACFRALTEAWLGREPEWRESLRFALRRSPVLVLASIVYFLAMVVGFVLLIVPGMWVSVAFALCFPAILVERLGPVSSLRRSARLVRGRWWATFGVLLLGFLLATVLSGIAQALVAIPLIVAVDDGSVLALAISSLAGAVGFLIATPFQAAIVALAYFDLRVRKEGLDLELVAERLGTSGPPTSPASTSSSPPSEPRPGADVPGWQPPAGWQTPTPDP